MARRLTLDFLKTEAASGMILGFAALLALVVANSPLSEQYFYFLKSEHTLQIGPVVITESVTEWIKEGLMTVFFFVVGLEIKYEIMRGELSDPRKLATPALAALGGMIAPALVYLAVVNQLGGSPDGWSIPVATDIAFALAAFALAGRGLPASLRVFLLTLAIVDDLGAIAIIAVVFSQGVQLTPLIWALAGLAVMGLAATRWRLPALTWIIGFVWVWYFTLESGVSTSLAGVAYALAVPIDSRTPGREGQLKGFMHALHPWVAFMILPLFAFAKAGVAFGGLSIDRLLSPVALGVAAGLFIGKQIGVFGAAALASATPFGVKPTNATWTEIYGVSLLCGVGFTMSFFIGALAFPGAVDSPAQVDVKLGVLAGSIASAALGAVILSRAAGRRRALERADREALARET